MNGAEKGAQMRCEREKNGVAREKPTEEQRKSVNCEYWSMKVQSEKHCKKSRDPEKWRSALGKNLDSRAMEADLRKVSRWWCNYFAWAAELKEMEVVPWRKRKTVRRAANGTIDEVRCESRDAAELIEGFWLNYSSGTVVPKTYSWAHHGLIMGSSWAHHGLMGFDDFERAEWSLLLARESSP